MSTRTRSTARVFSALSAAFAGLTLFSTPAAHAAAGPLPPTFQIRSDNFGQCAYPQSDAPHGLRMDPCAAGDLSERWLFDPITQQVTNSRDATKGLCLTGIPYPGAGAVTMTPCNEKSTIQRWELFEYDGKQYMAQADGSGRVLTARAAGVDWQLFPWDGNNMTQFFTFPTL